MRSASRTPQFEYEFLARVSGSGHSRYLTQLCPTPKLYCFHPGG